MMDIFLNDTCQVAFPGNKISGVFCVREYIHPTQKPVIEVTGYTSIFFRLGTQKEIHKTSNFFKSTATLSPSEVDDADVSLKNRYNSYSKIFTFYLTLPNNLPPSHEIPFGHTRYKLEACFNDQKVSTFFSVNNWVYLKQNNDAAVKCITFPLLSFIGRCKAELYLDRLHYFPGETVNVRAIIKNYSPNDILSSQIFIEQITKYWITGYRTPLKHVRDIAESPGGSYLHRGEEIEYNYSLNIPTVIPSTCTSKTFVINYEVKYNIKMLITMYNFKKLELNQQLFIGNLGILNNSQFKVIHCEAEELEDIIVFKPRYLIYDKRRI